MKANKQTLPSIERVHETLEYDGNIVRWKDPPKTFRVKHGSIAGCEQRGRWRICLDQRIVLRSWIVWALVNKKWPSGDELDHINRNPMDDRIQNLREATRSQQNANKWMSNNSIGFRSIGFNATKKNPWSVRIGANGKRKRYGMFATLEIAAKHADKIGREIYGNYWVMTKAGLK